MSRKRWRAKSHSNRGHEQPLQAELQNDRRVTQEKPQAASRAKTDVLKALLPILADMRLALQHADQDADAIRRGVEMICRKFEEFMRDQGAEPIATVGERFDPACHDAKYTAPATGAHPPGTIVSELTPGYVFEGQLLAAAQVVVARAAETATSRRATGARRAAVRDVTPFFLGLETGDGVMTKLIGRNTPLPARASHILSTDADNQSSIEIHVLQGKHETAARNNRSLGRFHFADIPPAPRGVPRIKVTLSIDTDGLVSGKAKDLGTGKEMDFNMAESK